MTPIPRDVLDMTRLVRRSDGHPAWLVKRYDGQPWVIRLTGDPALYRLAERRVRADYALPEVVLCQHR